MSEAKPPLPARAEDLDARSGDEAGLGAVAPLGADWETYAAAALRRRLDARPDSSKGRR